MNEKVTYKRLVSANVLVDNSNDEDRSFDINADVKIENGVVTNMESGRVVKQGMEMATFNYYMGNRLTVTYNEVEAGEQCNINNAINEFIGDVKAKTADSAPFTL